jgi:mono/diheme cytochrome c family protein
MLTHRLLGRAFSAFAGVTLFALAWPAAAQVTPAAVQRGQKLAKEACAMCHAIAGAAPSPLKDAPPFPTLLLAFPGRSLEEILARGLISPHVTMPVFLATSQNMDDLLAYLTSVQVRRLASLDGQAR